MSDLTETVESGRTVADSAAIDVRSRGGVVTARLVGFAKTGAPVVGGAEVPIRLHGSARSCVALGMNDIGKRVAVMFDTGSEAPIIIGVIQPETAGRTVDVTVDGVNITVTAQENLTLKCGDASITLSRNGKISIRGKHVVTQASGVNRIRGGSVQLN